MSDKAEPQIYVGCLASYNNGDLHGVWIDANQTLEDMATEIEEMLETSPALGAEEYAIFDFQGFGAYRVGEYTPLEEVAAVAGGIEEHGEAFAAWVSYDSYHLENLESFEDAFLGEYDSVADYAENLLNDLGVFDSMKEHLGDMWVAYLDVDKYARDLEYSGDIWTIKNGAKFLVFSSHY